MNEHQGYLICLYSYYKQMALIPEKKINCSAWYVKQLAYI